MNANRLLVDNADGVAADANVDNIVVVTRLYGFNGTTYDRLRTRGTGILQVNREAVAAGGATKFTGQFAATVTNIKTSAGKLFMLDMLNTTAAVAYLQVFNALAVNVTLGTTAPDYSFGLAASGVKIVTFVVGADFATAISAAGTTTRTGSTGAAIDVNGEFI